MGVQVAASQADQHHQLIIAALSVGIAGLVRRWELATVGLVLGMAAAGLRVMPLVTGPVHSAAQQRATARITGLVTSDAVVHETRDGLDWSARRLQVFRVQTTSVTARGHQVAVHVPVVVFCTCVAPPLGVQVDVSGRLLPATPGRGIAATVSAMTVRQVRGPPRYQAWAQTLRQALHVALRGKPAAAVQLVPGLALGDTTLLDSALAADMRAAGLSHLTAVSGANVALVVAAAVWATRGRRRTTRAAATLLAICAFTILVRPQPSVVRAAAMGSVMVVALLLRRRTTAVVSLATAVTLLIVWDPWLATSYGFALSVLATGGLLIAPVRPRRWWGTLVAATVCAQIAVLPVTVALGTPVTLAALPANLVSVPLAGPAMVAGVLACLTAAAWPSLGSLLAWLAVLPAQTIAWVAHAAAGLDAAVVPWPSGALGVVVAMVLSSWLGWHAVRWSRLDAVAKSAAVGATAVLIAACLAPPDPATPAWPPPGWVMVQCDVGQGDATVVRVAKHQAVVVDTGPDPAAVDHCLSRLQVTRVPLLILTHFHADHVAGLAGVLHRRRVDAVLTTALAEPPALATYVGHVLRTRRLVGQVLTFPAVVQVGSLVLHCVWPARLIRGQGSDPNNASIVLRFDIASVRFLLAGDVEPPAQDALATMVGQVDVLKMAHHGSAHQSPSFAAAVRPRVVTVSVGIDNDYGHPAASALALYQSLGATVVRTDRVGDIAVVVRDGAPVVVVRGRHT